MKLLRWARHKLLVWTWLWNSMNIMHWSPYLSMLYSYHSFCCSSAPSLLRTNSDSDFTFISLRYLRWLSTACKKDEFTRHLALSCTTIATETTESVTIMPVILGVLLINSVLQNPGVGALIIISELAILDAKAEWLSWSLDNDQAVYISSGGPVPRVSLRIEGSFRETCNPMKFTWHDCQTRHRSSRRVWCCNCSPSNLFSNYCVDWKLDWSICGLQFLCRMTLFFRGPALLHHSSHGCVREEINVRD